MTYVVTANCDNCKYTDCVEVCPVEAFHEGPISVFINAETCIDCDVCVAQCPVEAIFAEEDVPPEEREFIALNRELAAGWPVIAERKPAPPDADEWAGRQNKRGELTRS